MLGMGHAPSVVLEAMNKPHVMANVMTPSISQMDFVARIREEVGHTRGVDHRSPRLSALTADPRR